MNSQITAPALGDRNPVAHHVTNIVVIAIDDDTAVRSKGLGVAQNGTIGSVTYVDRVTRMANRMAYQPSADPGPPPAAERTWIYLHAA